MKVPQPEDIKNHQVELADIALKKVFGNGTIKKVLLVTPPDVNEALFFNFFFSSSVTIFSDFCFFLTYKTHINCLTGKNKAALKRTTQIGS